MLDVLLAHLLRTARCDPVIQMAESLDPERRLRRKLIESAGWSCIDFSTWTPVLRWQPRRPQALGQMCGVHRVVVGPRPHVLIHSEIGFEL